MPLDGELLTGRTNERRQTWIFKSPLCRPLFSTFFGLSRFRSRTRLRYELSSRFLPPAFISTNDRDRNVGGGARKEGRMNKTKFLSEKLESSRCNEETGIKQYRVPSLRKVECDSRHASFVPQDARSGGSEIIVLEFQSLPKRVHRPVYWSVLIPYFTCHLFLKISRHQSSLSYKQWKIEISKKKCKLPSSLRECMRKVRWKSILHEWRFLTQQRA